MPRKMLEQNIPAIVSRTKVKKIALFIQILNPHTHLVIITVKNSIKMKKMSHVICQNATQQNFSHQNNKWHNYTHQNDTL
jgi:hypothetical protein